MSDSHTAKAVMVATSDAIAIALNVNPRDVRVGTGGSRRRPTVVNEPVSYRLAYEVDHRAPVVTKQALPSASDKRAEEEVSEVLSFNHRTGRWE